MSSQSIASNIAQCERNIRSHNEKLSREMTTEAQRTARIGQIRQSINRYTSQSQLNSYEAEIKRLDNDIANIQRNKASIQQDIARETEKYHRYQADYRKALQDENKKFQDDLKKQTKSLKDEQNRLSQAIINLASTPEIDVQDIKTNDSADLEYDCFISHASEDKDEIVRPLAQILTEAGYRVWYDEFRLKVGDSLRKSIDKGLASSRFGIVVLSPSFLSKNWTEYELNSLVAMEIDKGGKVILPLWHRLTKADVIKYSPSLADKLALNTATNTIEEIAGQIREVLDDNS